jgi:hypothetical protein
MDAVERWFDTGFSRLHPLLQSLHRSGGTLLGSIRIQYGRGVASVLGRRMAGRMGLPRQEGEIALHVDIRSDAHALHWDRRFGDSTWMRSRFHPVGTWPQGYWVETVGALRIALRVDVTDGGWRWQPRRVWVHGMRVPMVLMPQVDASKRIEDGRYVFEVRVTLPMLGLLFAYGGRLQAETTTTRTGAD